MLLNNILFKQLIGLVNISCICFIFWTVSYSILLQTDFKYVTMQAYSYFLLYGSG